MTEAAIKTRFRVGGMDCAACASKIETAVARLPEVQQATASFTAGTLAVTHGGALSFAAVERQVTALGYTIAPAVRSEAAKGEHDGHEHAHFDAGDGPWWKTRKALLAAGCGVALALAWLAGWLLPQASHWAFLVAIAVGLVPIAWRAVQAAVAGTPFTIETLMTIAAIGAVFIGAGNELALLVGLLLAAGLLTALWLLRDEGPEAG